MKKLLSALLLLPLPVFACGELTVTDAWIRLAPPGASVMAGYASFSNPHDQSVLIQGASASGFERVELHSMRIDKDGKMQMRELERIEVKSGQSVALSPGGDHFMLIAPERELAVGDSIDVALTLCEEKQQTVRFTVAESAGDSGHVHHHAH